MITTVYRPFDDEDLVRMALRRDNRTELEVELAQRLAFSLDYINTYMVIAPDEEEAYGTDTRRPC